MTDPAHRPRIAPQEWMAEPATRAVLAALAAGGVEARFVGGAVRDALLGLPIGDIDIATPAPPERMTELLQRAGIRVVPTGIAHGTVTALMPPRHFEITTLRRDVETYGRRARVAFDADWAADAARRDFTINAIFLAPDGAVYDPVGGLADLQAGHVRFVGDPATRIAEDMLRLLRYYRFEARFGAGGGDEPARAACRAAAHLLPTLSAERVAQELVRLLVAPGAVRALRMMQEDGVLSAMLPEAKSIERLQTIIAIDDELPVNHRGIVPLLRLAALIVVDREGAVAMAERLHFSNAWRDRLAGLIPPWPIDPAADAPAQRRTLYRLGEEPYRDIAKLMAAEGLITARGLVELLDLAGSWVSPEFPLTGHDVTALGLLPGPRVGALLDAVERWWEKYNFAPDRDQCLARLRELAIETREPSPI
jgi:poly(A) polymerase